MTTTRRQCYDCPKKANDSGFCAEHDNAPMPVRPTGTRLPESLRTETMHDYLIQKGEAW